MGRILFISLFPCQNIFFTCKGGLARGVRQQAV